VDIITKSPISKEGNLAKLDSTIEKVKLLFPSQSEENKEVNKEGEGDEKK